MFSVIMAGGSGTRFWPVSRKKEPKQFLNITGKETMIVETCDRIKPLARDEEMIIILGREHLEKAKDIFKGRNVNILSEPVGRNTAPCIGLGAIYARYLGCNGPVAFLPADHFIADVSPFLEMLDLAADLADTGGIVTLGIVPDRPETGYGYIRRDQGIVFKESTVYSVLEFVEKPDFDTARLYLESGEYYWNGGIFVASPETILKEIEELMPDLYLGLQQIDKMSGKEGFEKELENVYMKLESTSFDYGIMERTTENVYVIPCDCGWTDVGSWESLYELKSLDHDNKKNLVDGEALLIDSERNFISSRGGRQITCLGLKNCLVVDTSDVLLIADLSCSQDIRKIVEELKRNEKEDLI
ncbi:MAG TPA: mannose-1-phosphate guanylyltransferase [Desulfobacteraceae bacterium]|nr:mannose-1-phosphate guanylyltransferase [Desulfobacteraceae bacterium]HPJ67075.1 mannose-1-phosphate guanylyltransferase [Desulfobacteraceae bacterium]HPQ29030.1 mannose-1-phosphate guanylyltransferase [Desulfobacteraceae bacterium]